MSKYVDLSERVTASYYDEEHEEWTQKTVTVADVLDSVCDDYTDLPSIDAVPVKRRGVGYTGIDDDYLISIKEVIDITAETGAIETQRRIKELIPIDAVEVVRCKDCKYRYHSVECPCQSYDHFYSWIPADDWFCKKGERKES